MTLYLQDEAASDLDNASSWYERQSTGLGSAFLDEVLSTFDRIEENPLSYPLVASDLRRASMGRFPFCVFFRYDPDRIQIFAVIHASRDPNTWQSRI